MNFQEKTLWQESQEKNFQENKNRRKIYQEKHLFMVLGTMSLDEVEKLFYDYLDENEKQGMNNEKICLHQSLV